jgi:Uma2 family endonuclease
MSVLTQPISLTNGRSAAVPTEPIYRLNVAQYQAMIRSGILTKDDPVELLEGWLVVKMPKNPPHRLSTRLTRTALERIVPPGWYVDTQEPVTLEDSEPEPDVTVVRGDPRQYADRHPGPQDLALLVEVADSSLQRDRATKRRLYAEARLSIYWIINLLESHVEVYTDPSGPAERPDYGQRQVYGVSDVIPVALDGIEVGRIAVRELLP